MLCRKFGRTLFLKSTLNNNVHYCLAKQRFYSKRCILDGFFATVRKSEGFRMSSFRFVLKDFSVARLWSAWTRRFMVNTVVRRVKRDRCVRQVFDRFRQTIFRPRRTFLLSATAAFRGRGDDSNEPPSCEENITDEDLEALLLDLEAVEHLSKTTIYCTSCGKRLVIDNKKQPGVGYCACKEPQQPRESPDGWVPYLEAEDVIIWRKEYKRGQGMFAYKVYGRYKEVKASDFAAVQVDGPYRRHWDAAVAALSVVERRANGIGDQAVLHWEVLWPRLFANRDYVYIRRHKEFASGGAQVAPAEAPAPKPPPPPPERPNVHTRAKIAAQQLEKAEEKIAAQQLEKAEEKPPVQDENKVFVIVSRSCVHPKVPESKRAIRVMEYWSHMVVRSLEGSEKPGMEFVLTYYDEPAVGGLPSGVATWATGRAAPAYLARMRSAAAAYARWRQARPAQELPDFTPFGSPKTPTEVSLVPITVREQDMESSKDGPDLFNGCESRDEGTQTDDTIPTDGRTKLSPADDTAPTKDSDVKTDATAPSDGQIEKQAPAADEAPVTDKEVKSEPSEQVKKPVASDNIVKVEESSNQIEGDSDKPEEEDSNSNSSWWRYLYPLYYFV